MKLDHKKALKQLNIARGQIEGIIRLVNEDAYCLDVSNQILATTAVLKRINEQILTAHLKNCVLNATPDELETKVNEITALLKRIS